MDLKIIAVRNSSNPTEEYVLLSVQKDCNLGDYFIFDTTYTNKSMVSNKERHVYWFTNKHVKAGEIVSVHTGKGEDKEHYLTSGTKEHKFFWNLDVPIWNNTGDKATLVKIAEKESFIVSST